MLYLSTPVFAFGTGESVETLKTVVLALPTHRRESFAEPTFFVLARVRTTISFFLVRVIAYFFSLNTTISTNDAFIAVKREARWALGAGGGI